MYPRRQSLSGKRCSVVASLSGSIRARRHAYSSLGSGRDCQKNWTTKSLSYAGDIQCFLSDELGPLMTKMYGRLREPPRVPCLLLLTPTPYDGVLCALNSRLTRMR